MLIFLVKISNKMYSFNAENDYLFILSVQFKIFF